MTISIPDTLTTDNSEKYIVSIRLRSGGLSFPGMILGWRKFLLSGNGIRSGGLFHFFP